jgi:hypothetical protein
MTLVLSGKEDLELTLTTTGRKTVRMILVLSGKEDLELTLTNTDRRNPEDDTCAQWEGRSGIDPTNTCLCSVGRETWN